MASTYDQHQNLVLVFGADSASLIQELRIVLTSSGYRCTVVNRRDEGLKIVKAQSPAVIIAPATNRSLKFYEAIRALSLDLNPFLIAITDRQPDEGWRQTADLVLLPESYALETQLQPYLHMCVETIALQNQLYNLLQKAESLESQLNAQRRSNSEVEILKNAIVRNVSHELKTPLLQVKSAVSLIAEDGGEPKLIQYATNATARLETLVKHITMLGTSLDIKSLGPVIPRDAVEYALRNLRRIWQHKGDVDRIATFLDDNLPPVVADKQGLSTVIHLLLDNALKFSDDAVEIHVRRETGAVRIAVRDYGIGIAEDHLNAIFEAFVQLDSSATRRYGGAGVGLAIVRLILEYQNSQIEVESEIGSGSSFSFRLPVFERG
jgi:signal transduction histidine kinase